MKRAPDRSTPAGRRFPGDERAGDPQSSVTAGKVRPELKLLGVAAKVRGGQLAGDDFAVAARWGIADKGGSTMPGSGDAREREFSAAEAAALGESQTTLVVERSPDRSTPADRRSPGDAGVGDLRSPVSAGSGDPRRTALGETLLGAGTLDIYLNAAAYWRNVPRQVWEYTLGGYQVLKKWLSYRELALLGRPLTVDELAYFSQTVRRIAGLTLLGPELDENYGRVKAETYAWKAE